MSKEVQIVLLCEDRQHRAFVTRFLEASGRLTRKSRRRLRVLMAPRGRGSGSAYVLSQFPLELAANRQNRNRVASELLVMVDGDAGGPANLVAALDEACKEKRISVRKENEPVSVFVPTWNIETWFAYLDGDEVDEKRKNYPRLDRQRECGKHAALLSGMCREGALREPAPASLTSACTEFHRGR